MVELSMAKIQAEKITKEIAKLPPIKNMKDFDIVAFLKKNWLLILILIYMVSPLDFIPVWLFGPLGLADDITLLVIELIRRAIMSTNSQESDATPSPKTTTNK